MVKGNIKFKKNNITYKVNYGQQVIGIRGHITEINLKIKEPTKVELEKWTQWIYDVWNIQEVSGTIIIPDEDRVYGGDGWKDYRKGRKL
jgi:hypothetical protein